MNNKNVIPIAIAGLGRTGRGNHAGVFVGMPNKFKIVAVSDTEPSRREEAARIFGCAVFDTFEQLIADDKARLVVVATPNHLHCHQTIQALQAGKGVICEKPMALNLSEVDAMMETARTTGQLLTIFQNSRYAANFEKLAEVIASGVLGRIIQIRIRWNRFGRRWDWQTLHEYGGGSLNNTIPHPLDQILSLFPMDEPEIFFHADKTVSLGDTEDHVKILLRHHGMPLVDLEASNADGVPGPLWTVLGTSGHLQGGESRLDWKYFDPRSLPEREVSRMPSSDLTYNKETIPWIHKEWVAPSDLVSSAERFYQRLHGAILSGTEPDVRASQVRRVMSIIERCRANMSFDSLDAGSDSMLRSATALT